MLIYMDLSNVYSVKYPMDINSVKQNLFSIFRLLLDLPDVSVEKCGTCSLSVMILRETVS